MKEDKKKEEGSIWFLIAAVLLLAYLAYFEVYKKDIVYYLKNGYQLEKDHEYNGVIYKKYADKRNHNSSMVEFTNGTHTGIHPYFWGKIQKGDSISKVAGDSVIQVFRNNEKIILEIAPFYREAIEEEKKKEEMEYFLVKK